MKNKGRLYLCLAIACFIGVVAIFGVNDFLGIYDTIYITAGEYEKTIGPYRPFEGIKKPPTVEGECGGVIHFRYEIVNRHFSSYSVPVQASVWIRDKKIMDLLSQDIRIKPFGEAVVECDFDIWEIEPQELGYIVRECMVKMEHGEVKRDVIVDTSCRVAAWYISVEVDEQTKVEEAVNIIKGLPWVTEVTVTDIHITTGNKTFVINIRLQSLSHNLTDEELIVVKEQTYDALSEIGASLRN